MYRGVGKILVVLAASACVGCPGGSQDAEEYAKRQAELADKDMLGKAVKVETTLQSGVQVACDKVFDIEKLTSLLKESSPVTISDQSEKSPDTTSTCSIRRGGEPPSEKAQAKALEKSDRLGVLGGDELCNVTLYCSIPADLEGLKNRCKTDGMQGSDVIGTYACVKVTPKGEQEGYTYRFIEPDTKCTVRVMGGPSVADEAFVQSCARAAMELLVPESVTE